ncbi:integrase [Parvularcula sp. ZS-1/3]|uniref:Integrase n=1 Tax=Parvularcula mediterranea TaxID=2732508 RepID=A0A7Y3RLW1_9PROT|nr:DUF6538 domain-containing protein [Parvularcula mediterranea]NNU16498.1 integrase [Parvularcula mediterranea]
MPKPPRKHDHYLLKRSGRYYYYRRVPEKYRDLDPRGTIKTALKTDSLEMARMRRDSLAHSDEELWKALELSLTEGDKSGTSVAIARRRYNAAQARALAYGFTYRPMDELIDEGKIEEIVARVLAIDNDTNGPKRSIRAHRETAEALLGAVPVPDVRVSDAFKLYLEDIAFDAQYGKSPAQKEVWLNTKKRSIGYFIQVIGDISMEAITREHAIDYKKWWAERLLPQADGSQSLKPATANRAIGDMRTLYQSYFEHVGQERTNPFRGIRFKAKTRTEVPAFENEWVRTRILEPGALSGLNPQLQVIVLMLIETGCRPSEIMNLDPEDFHLGHVVPHISIRAKEGREIKTETSIRDIPLVGVSLEAAKRMPGGFPHYRDKNNLFSASVVKAFRNRGLFPTPNHVIYSFRHAFEKRMQEANIDFGLRCLLMGHKTSRPAYGDGGSLAYRRDELLKIAHPFSESLFSEIDRSVSVEEA